MASAVIHLCVAKKINEKLNVDDKAILLGSIAPDISKQLGQSKVASHFLTSTVQDIPNITLFLEKYKDSLTNPFDLGYFIHLYTDKIWFEEYISTKALNNSIKLLDGTTISLPDKEITRLIYEDYTNLNIALLDEYNLDLSLFYEDIPIPKSDITEIPVEKLSVLTDKMGVIIKNSKEEKHYVFDMSFAKEFIDYSTAKILDKIEEIKK